jgi:D-sedoheptulose 7-phosphate isomerase
VKRQDERLQKRSVRRAGKKTGKIVDKRQRKKQAEGRAGADQYQKGAREALRGSAQLLGRMADSFAGWAGQAAMEMVTRLNRGGKIMCCGNGGSAADAQHIAAELSGKFYLNRRALPAVSITTNPSSVTAISNDYGYEHVFSKQIEGLGRSGDVLLAFSTSGGSPNVHRAVGLARKMGIFVIGFTGAGGAAFARKCDMCLVVPSLDCPRIQEAHIAVGHSICFLVERAIFGEK